MKRMLVMLAMAVLAGTVWIACGRAESPSSPTPVTPATLSVHAIRPSTTGNAANAFAVLATAGTADTAPVPAHILRPTDFPQLQGAVVFPPRNEPGAFFADLQALYRDVLKRPQTAPSYVDPEGQSVWLTEYFRFYLNGCSHMEAMSRTLAEVTTGMTWPVCGGETIVFPPRSLPNEFQMQLETVYRSTLHRPLLLSYVDSEGANVWLSEYLRYRVAGNCGHLDAQVKVFAQIQGAGVLPACAPTLTASPATLLGGQNVTATWVAADWSPSDWIGLWATTAPDALPLIFISTRAASGSVTFKAPNYSGAYHFRLFRSWTRLATSNVVQVTGPPPQYWFEPSEATIPSVSGTYTIQVRTASPDIRWNVAGDYGQQSPWWSIVSGFSGMGNATVTYRVNANPGSSPRAGTLTVSGLSGHYPSGVFRFQQEAPTGSCGYQLTSPSSYVFTGTGTTALTYITLTQTGGGLCTWAVTPLPAPWIGVRDPWLGTGDIRIPFVVEANTTGADRQDTVRVRWGTGFSEGVDIRVQQTR